MRRAELLMEHKTIVGESEQSPPMRAAWPLALGLFALAVLAQELTYAYLLRPEPAIAGGYGVSAAIGLLHGRGLTVSPDEAWAAKVAQPDEDLLDLYDPLAPRLPAHEPLPGTPLLFAAVGVVTGTLCLGALVHLQIVLHGLGVALLFLCLRWRSRLAAVLAATAWALFIPQSRSVLAPGYDVWTSFVYLLATAAMLTHHRTGNRVPLFAAGVICATGLWIRSYLFVLPCVLLSTLVLLRRAHARDLMFLCVPLLISGACLHEIRRPDTGVSHPFIRGGFWHSFWAGIGQFENEWGVVSEDSSVREFAARRAEGLDFRVPNYQYDRGYDETLRDAARDLVGDRPWLVIRNAVYRIGWLLFPVFMPSTTLAANPVLGWISIGVGVPVSLLSILGFWIAFRRDRGHALLLAAPWLSLLPLAGFYFVAKVPVGVFFTQIAFAALAAEAILTRSGLPLRRLSAKD